MVQILGIFIVPDTHTDYVCAEATVPTMHCLNVIKEVLLLNVVQTQSK